jgi:phosphoribosylpyrophosphate synthetase
VSLNLETKPVFVEETLPEDSIHGRIYRHALRLERQSAHDMWVEGTSKRNQLLGSLDDPFNHQIIIFQRNPEKIQDVTNSLFQSPLLSKLSSLPIVRVNHSLEFDNHEPKNESIGLESGVKSIYGIASIVDERDLFSIIATADRCKDELGVECFTLVVSFLAGARQDKNVNKEGKYEHQAINNKAMLKMLSTVVDRMIVVEPHSSATQAFAAERGMPLLPLSLWKVMADEVKNKGVRICDGSRVKLTVDNTRIIGPDDGRNHAAGKISDYLCIPRFGYSKIRKTESSVTINGDHLENEGVILKNKIGVGFDDVITGVSTVDEIAEDLQYKKGAEAYIVLAAHLELVGLKWAQRINNPFISNIFATNSRQPLGDLNPYGKTEWVDLAPWLCDVIEKDMRGDDPYFIDSRISEVL